MTNLFSLGRFQQLLKFDLYNHIRTFAYPSAIFIALMLFEILFISNGSGRAPTKEWSVIMLFCWGPFIAGNAFRELDNNQTAIPYLLLPASHFEKVTSRCLSHIFLFGIYVIGLAHIVPLIDSRKLQWNSDLYYFFLFFLVTQSWYFLGGAVFRKRRLIKTTLCVIAAAFLVAGCGFLSMKIFANLLPWLDISLFIEEHSMELWSAIQWFFISLYITFLFLCWGIAWWRVTKYEARNGV